MRITRERERDIPADKVALYKKLTEELSIVDSEYYKLRNISKANHKTICDFRDDISRWKETCWRQSDHIHKLYLISAIQFLTILGLIGWISFLLIFR
jgi:hypothetical protein